MVSISDARHRSDLAPLLANMATAPGSTAALTSSLKTTYFGYQISIEPAEWGFLVLVAELRSGVRLIGFSKSAMQALENAFDIIDDRLGQRKDRSRGC